MPTFYQPRHKRFDKRNSTFVVRGRINGQQRQLKTSATSRREAEREWQDFAASERYRPARANTFREAVTHYKATGQRPASQVDFLEKVLIYSSIGDMELDAITPGLVREVAAAMYPGRKPATLNRNVIVPVRAVINNAAEDGWCGHIRIKAFPVEQPTKTLPSDRAGEILLKNTEGVKRLYIAALHYQGLRPSEAVMLHWDNIDLQRGVFELFIPKAKRAKLLVLDDDFRAILAESDNKTGKVFPWANRSGIYNWLSPLCKRLGVRFGARMARHQFASDLAAHGASEHDIVNAGSWTSTGAVKNYVTLREDRAREILRKRKRGG